MDRNQQMVFGLIVGVALFWSLTAMFGCASAPASTSSDAQPLRGVDGHRRSLVADSRAMVAMRASPTAPGAVEPAWYASRADRPSAVVVGTRLPTIERTVTLQHDHLSTYDGRVYDHVDIRRRTISVQEQVTY
jgi:hypothetical protein